jgi:hypothetical protein
MRSESGASQWLGGNNSAVPRVTGISNTSLVPDLLVDHGEPSEVTEATPSKLEWSASDVAAICRECGWLGHADSPESHAWLAEAARLLGPQAYDRSELITLLAMIFEYDAVALYARPETCALLARSGARDVLREFATRVLEGPALDSDRFKQIVIEVKTKIPWRGQRLFHPIRLALAGRAGEGALDRVILLLDSAAELPFAISVKGTRQRMLEFCALLD